EQWHVAPHPIKPRDVRGGPFGPPLTNQLELPIRLLDGGRDALDLAGLELRVLRSHRALDRRGDLRAPLAVPDTGDAGAELLVGAAGELAVVGGLDRVVDGDVDALQRARHHPRSEVALIGVDADTEDVLLVRRVEDAEAALACDLELDDRALGDLV